MTGGLVVNSGLTMQLSDVDKFTWGEDSLSFYWEDITNGANVNQATEFIMSMLLYTPADWYWDTLTIEAWNTEVEDVGSEAGIEADDEIIEDEEDEIVEDEDTDIEVGVEDEDVSIEDEDANVEVEGVVDVEVNDENPTTGNPDILTFIIPALMGSAAVVSKKIKK